MKRRIWLSAVVAALFGLQAPLCAVACLADSNPAQDTASHQPAEPCHETGASSSPADAPSAHEDCGCEFVYEALLPGVDAPHGPDLLAVLPQAAPWRALDSLVHVAYAIPGDSDLPPPDILLLESTLII